jgi:uncharacterized coiled-coil DUF342 family protein
MFLSNSEKFANEYKNFKERISLVTDTAVQLELTQLLNQLAGVTKRIDNYHQELVYNNKLPDNITSTRDEIRDIRKKLIKLLDSWEKNSVRTQN